MTVKFNKMFKAHHLGPLLVVEEKKEKKKRSGGRGEAGLVTETHTCKLVVVWHIMSGPEANFGLRFCAGARVERRNEDQTQHYESKGLPLG